MKILLLGKTGQIGRQLQRFLPVLGDLVPLSRKQADLSDAHALGLALSIHQPDVIVNAAAYTAVDRAQLEPEAAASINTDAVAQLARYAKESDALLVHYGTDYIFDGTKPTPYCEADIPNPLNVYGATKLAGDAAVLDSGCDALILRCSWVYAAHGQNFPSTLLRLAATRDNLDVVADQVGAPTSAALIADTTVRAIAARTRRELPGGIYHLAASGSTSWHAYARYLVAGATERGVPLRLTPENIHPVSSDRYGAAAKRPRNSRLDTTRLETALNVHFDHWTCGVDDLLDELSKRGRRGGDNP